MTILGTAMLAAAAVASLPQASVPLYDDLGSHHHAITAANPQTQRYFDQGLRLVYAFNHAEAVRAFQEAERRDPRCAMCPWGIALAYGPNINAPMDSAAAVAAYAAIQRAVARSSAGTSKERALITALSQRYAAAPIADRPPLDSAYARAMARVADAYPADGDVQVLYADALMNLSPWNYWTRDGSPRPDTPEVLRRLETVMQRDPDNPGACHLFIHAVEATTPERAVPCAERLAGLMPGAGHIVHMPGHIYVRVGRYADAIEANRHAVHADESYLEGPSALKHGIYAQGYYPHNYHFMSFAASMAGRSAIAISAARAVVATIGPDIVREVGWLEAITPVTYWTLTTFGRWDEILREPLPPPEFRFATAMAYYARGVALAAAGRDEEARATLDTLAAVAQVLPPGDNQVATQIAAHALMGEMAARRGDVADAIDHFRLAVDLEDGLTYNEPPTWYYPMRHSLGKALLAAGRPAEAETVYREDLERFPENGWSLYGLTEALRAQGKAPEADAAAQRLRRAWAGADVTLTGSRF